MAADLADNKNVDIFCDMQSRAIKMWGLERARRLEHSLKQLATHLGHLEENPPDVEEEPAFFQLRDPVTLERDPSPCQ